jgi:hypothetical protein
MIIVTGKVISHAIRIPLTVFILRFLIPFVATIEPATPEDSTCVVLTGTPNIVESPIVVAATRLALAPWA